MKVLLVEDSLGMRKLITSMLKRMGYDDITEARHGSEAWDCLHSTEVELLMTDWNMPIMDGLELIKKLRQSGEYDDLPVLMFTARSSREDVVTALQAGADTYLTKPFTPTQLKIKIQSIMGRRLQRLMVAVLRNVDSLERHEEHPLVIFGEGATRLEQLGQHGNREIVHFLSQATASLGLINARLSELHIGYAIEGSSSDITRRMRAFRERIKLLVLSSAMPGGALTLARLASINKDTHLSVFLVCETVNEFTTRERHGLERLDVVLLERHTLDVEGMEQLFGEYVVANLQEGPPRELPTPEEIRKRLESDIRNTVSLPVLPQVYHQIAALDRDPESDIQSWIEAVETDPLSQAQVIRRARSPIYGFQGEINDTGKAVILLGKNTVKELIVSTAVRRSFEGIEDQSFHVEEYWLHSVAVATSARLLSFPLDEAQWTPSHKKDFESFGLSEEAVEMLKKFKLYQRLETAPNQDPFVGGMMHDIGKVALVHSYPGLFPLIIEAMKVQNWNLPMRFAEESVAGGANHCQVGGILAQSWRLGREVCQLIEEHHSFAADRPYAQLIALADFIGGGIYPYPKQAAYPTIELLAAPAAEGGGEAPRGKDAGEEKPQEQSEQEDPPPGEPPGAAAEDARTAAAHFLPEGLLEHLEFSLDDLLALGRALAPAVRRLTEQMHKEG